MLEKNLSEQILSIGNRSDRPDGGISQVLYNYRFYVFPVFKSITNFKIGSKPYKLYYLYLQPIITQYFASNKSEIWP